MSSRQAGPDVEIIPATCPERVDSRAIATLGLLAWGREATEDQVADIASKLAAEFRDLDPATKAIFLAQTSGGLVGFCRVLEGRDDATQWWLAGIVVHPEHHRRGIGRALALEASAYACARGARVLRSETHTDNTVSIAFHEGVGFRNDGEFTASDGDAKVAFSLGLPTTHR